MSPRWPFACWWGPPPRQWSKDWWELAHGGVGPCQKNTRERSHAVIRWCESSASSLLVRHLWLLCKTRLCLFLPAAAVTAALESQPGSPDYQWILQKHFLYSLLTWTDIHFCVRGRLFQLFQLRLHSSRSRSQMNGNNLENKRIIYKAELNCVSPLLFFALLASTRFPSALRGKNECSRPTNYSPSKASD